MYDGEQLCDTRETGEAGTRALCGSSLLRDE